MLFVPNMIVVSTAGKYANKKGVIVSMLDERTALVAGVVRFPSKIEDHMSKVEKKKAGKFMIFLKKWNIKHLIATRYMASLGLEKINFEGVEDHSGKKKGIIEEVKKAFIDSIDGKKNKYLLLGDLVITKD